MNKKLLKYALAACSMLPLHANDTVSHTFFTVRPQFQGATPEKISLVHDRTFIRDWGIQGFLQVIPFASVSTNGPDLAKFFLPFKKTSVLTGEFGSEAVLNGTVDVLANYFGVLTRPVNEVFAGTSGFMTQNLTFQSCLSLNPTQSVFGVGLSYRQRVNSCESKRSLIWVQIAFPIMSVSNRLDFKETILNSGGGTLGESVSPGFVGTVGNALRGCPVFGDQQFLYGKIFDGKKTKAGVADIELSLGFENQGCDIFHRLWYGGIIIPTGNTPNGEYIFEPILGNNHHWGVMAGGEYSYEWWTSQDNDKQIWFRSYGHSHYLFSNVQRRSFDIIDKQWGRYIWMYNAITPTATPTQIIPGINLLTQKVTVQARSSFTANVAAELETLRWILEGGYNTYYRQIEEVKLNKQCQNKILGYIVGIDEGNTNVFATKSNATIRRYLNSQSITLDQNPDGSVNYVPVTSCDLDLESAAHPCVVSHILYLTGGYRWDCIEFPTLLGGGASYEFSVDNLALKRWSVWAKLAISF